MANEAGSYILSDEVLLTSYLSEAGTNDPISINIRQLMQEIQIFEGINKSVLSGYITLVDAAGVMDDLPLTGHELLQFRLHTPGFSPKDTKFPKGFDFIKNPMYIYRINNILKPTPGAKMYTLEFCSKEEIRNSQKKVCKAYHNPIHTSVGLILRAELGSPKDFMYEETKFTPKYVIPKLTPLNAIKFLASESVSKRTNSSGYFFYETSDGFHFKSLGAMIHTGASYKTPVMDYVDSPKTDSGKMYKSKDGKAGNLGKVLDFKIVSRYDTLKNIRKGVYASRLVSYNGMTKEFKEEDFSYPHEYEKMRHMGQLVSGKESSGIMPIFNFENEKIMSDYPEGKYMFRTTGFGMHDTQAMKDGKENRINDVPIEDTLQRKVSQKEAFNNIVIEILVPGNTAVSAGDVINFQTLTSTKDKKSEEDPYMSGRYLVTEIRHLLQVKKHNMLLVCAKDSVGKEYLMNDREVLNINEKGVVGTDYEEGNIIIDTGDGIWS
jgi:hypothetical protein